MTRLLIPFVAVVLFYLEPVFGLFSPVEIGGVYYYLIPRFLIMFLIFVGVYYNRQRALMYAIIFGLLYDLFHIDIIGLYAFLYPAVCLLAIWAVRHIHQHIIVVTLITLLLVAVLETALYGFFTMIGFIGMPFGEFAATRLVPTMIANSVFLILLGWVFKSLANRRSIQKREGML
ncbi:rod shape-determining protein MreD [Bhargavaea beijingensis]|uniref:Rod shape-determining protein MreD n=1 Tax=Bhargavaea beijingensis TaxID=426756 RepID=A0ABX9Z9N0_9BACL|nr:rod shape-determining protein MreD [Bhargavaea beijingensis]RSK24646.1 rod shape-determining protein MreD [Bhargavaea beijingensis]